MSRRDDRYTDDVEIRVPEYDPRFSDISDRSYGEGNLNYYQRMQQQNRATRYEEPPYREDRRYEPPYDDRYDDRYEEDDDEIGGDTYDFGFAPKKKKKKKSRDTYEDSRERHRRERYEEDDDDYEDRPRKKKKKRHPVRRFLLTLLLIVAVLAGILMFFLHLAFSKLNRVDPVADTSVDRATRAAGVTPYHEAGVMNVLLIGQDARTGETQTRSDTMIICSLNMKTRKITLTSLMRDMYVPISGFDSNKLNAAYAYGGMETLDETIQENFGIDINGNAVVDLEGFLTAITSVGNLNIELTAEEAQYLNENPGIGSADDSVWENWSLTEGMNNMTPAQVLAYSRMRYVGNSDWDRTNRQKKVIQTAFSQIKTSPSKMIRVMNDVAPSITTDMTDTYLTKAVLLALLCGTDMDTYTIPGDTSYYADTIDGQAVLVPDLPECSSRLRSYIYGGHAANAETQTAAPVNEEPEVPDDTQTDDGDWNTEIPDNTGDQLIPYDADGDGIPDDPSYVDADGDGWVD